MCVGEGLGVRRMDVRPAIVLDERDSVATALADLPAGRAVELGGGTVVLRDAVPRGHKFALRAIAEGEAVLKYGQPIGRASAAIEPGQHVHVHNCVSQRATTDRSPVEDSR